MRLFTTILLWLMVLTVGCEQKASLHIGAKEFTEQLILAEMVAQLAEEQGIRVQRSIPYGDAFLCAEAIKKGDLDIYVEYTGTGLVMLGRAPLKDKEAAYTMVKELYQPLQLDWTKRLGFENSYVLVIHPRQAKAKKIAKISDLQKLPQIRFGCEPDFEERPVDGYGALLREYGLLKNARISLSNRDRGKLYEALLQDKIDVAIGYSTDGHIEDYGFVILDDDSHFFPIYEAAPLLRQHIAKRHPKLVEALNGLSGQIDNQTMRQMNRQIELEGYDYRHIARQFLREKGLLNKDQGKRRTAPKVGFAMGTMEELVGPARTALRAVRKTFAGRPVEIIHTPQPQNYIRDNKARVALLSAEAFFTTDTHTLPYLEALAVVGYRMCHLLAANRKIQSITQMRKLAVGPEQGASHHIATILRNGLAMRDRLELIPGEINQQISAVQAGELDGMLLMVPLEHTTVTAMIEKQKFHLVALPEWKQQNQVFFYPFLRPSIIPKQTYPGQTDKIETISAQLVLAGIARKQKWTGDMGPATALFSEIPPLSRKTVLQLKEAMASKERLHPALPAPDFLQPRKKSMTEQPVFADESALNALVMIGIVYLLFLFLREAKSRESSSKARE